MQPIILLSIKIIIKDKIAITTGKYVLQASINLGNHCAYNRPFYSCLLGCQSFE